MAKTNKKHPANCKCKDCKKNQTVKESVSLINFIKCVSEKNFAGANQHLQTVVEEKIKTRIRKCADVSPF